jgi:2-oxoisovalerate dehydrogenase E2 component (dihydrolipoyl transacylase)
MTTFNLPDLGEGLAEAEIVRWHVNVGDAVTVDQPMLAVETAKAVVEVPAPFSGVVKTLHGQPGDIIATGAPLIEFESNKSHGRTATPDAGTVVGNMPTSDEELIETAHAGGSRNRGNGVSNNVNAGNGATPTGSNGSNGQRAAPAARALAKKLNIDLTQLAGSGPGGVIIVDDIIAHSNVAPASFRAPATIQRAAPFAGGEQLRGLRRAMAQSMTLAHNDVANCTIFDDADLHRWRESKDFTLRLLRAIAAACQAEPALNAWFDGASQTQRMMPAINVGMAVDTAHGLIVPVIRDVGSRNAAQLREEIDRLKRAARDRTITPEDLRDTTFMLTNFGMMAGRYATPVVVPPTVAILGSGRLSRDVVAVDDRIEAHLRMPLSLTFDHRCVTGGEAARFLAVVLRDLEKDN